MNFGFSNLLGSPYRGGNACFHKDVLYVSVGNRVAKVQLDTTVTSVLKFETQCDIDHIALRPDGAVMAIVDKLGRLMLVNTLQQVVLHRMALKSAAHAMKYSPDGRYLAIGVGKLLQIWDCDVELKKTFAPLKLHVTHGSCHDAITSICWHSSGKWLAVGSRDLACHIFSRDKIEGFKGTVLTGHRDKPVMAQFVHDSGDLYTLSTDGKLLEWTYKPHDHNDSSSDEDKLDFSRGSWVLKNKHFIERQGSKITSCNLHSVSKTLVVGFKDGRFEVFQVKPDFASIQSMSVSRDALTTSVFNASSDLIAIGCAKLGQLLVWNWQNESYVFKQQGHFYDVLSIDFSKDGSQIVTGSADGKVKIWNVRTGLCFVTFTEHKMPVTAVRFIPSNHAVASASMDGTVRAFDLIRYRNFRTFQGAEPTQFSCLTIDPSGEILAAGSKDTFQIHVWSLKTGSLLDVFSGHEGPISGITFDGNGTTLATSSWDKTVQLWDTFTGKGRKESLTHYHDVLCLAYRPDGKQMCAGTLDGQLSFWETTNYSIEGTIDGRLDITGGRLSTDRRSLANTSSGKCFTTICYSADGDTLYAAGSSKFVCVYETSEFVLLSRIQLSQNISLDGVQEKLNSKYMTEAGSIDPLVEAHAVEDGKGNIGLLTPGGEVLPGTGADSRPVVKGNCICLSPAGDTWAAASTEGVLIYTKDESLLFDPFDLDEDVTPAAVKVALAKKEYAKALLMSIHLKDVEMFHNVIETIPVKDIDLVTSKIPPARLQWMMQSISECMSKSAHFEFYLTWCESILLNHGPYLKHSGTTLTSALRGIHKAIGQTQTDLTQTVEDNIFKLDYIGSVCKIPKN
jgi:periodic tryptophan protein 2